MHKILTIIFTLLLAVSLLTPVVAAETHDSQEVNQEVEKANKTIEGLIAKAEDEGAKLLSDYEANKEQATSKKELKALKKAYKENLDEIIDELLEITNEISAETIEYAAENGVEVKCEWVKVTIGDRKVNVDPLIVIGKY
jgi:transposase